MSERRRRAIAALLAACLAACGGERADPTAGTGPGAVEPAGPPPLLHCPGMAGCEAGSDGTLLAGAAKVDVTPRGFERVLPRYLDTSGAKCPDGVPRCGSLESPLSFRDCGADAVCPGDRAWTAPDADGTEGDDVLDFFRDCGLDDLCPDEPGWTAPDEGEGNGRFDGQWLAGFSNNRPAQGVHDPLWARAFALQSGDVTVAWVVVDAVGLFFEDLDAPTDPATLEQFPARAGRPGIRQRVRALAPDLDVDYVLAGATHTHEAPDTMGQWGMADGYRDGGLPTARGVDEAWLQGAVLEGAARAVVEAVRALRPAKASVAVAAAGAEALVEDTRSPPIVDTAVRVLRLAGAGDDETIATVVNWGNHPETVWNANNLVSSDFAHPLREAVEGGLPAAGDLPARPGAGGVCVYVQGTLGGLITTPPERPVVARDGTPVTRPGFAKARAVGERVAELALSALERAEPLAAPALSFGAERVDLPLDNTLFVVAAVTFDLFHRPYYHYDPARPDAPDNRPWLRTEVAVLRLGPVSFVTVPGELFPELSVGFDQPLLRGRPWAAAGNPLPPDRARIAELSPGPYLTELAGGDVTFVAGLTLDELGYIVPRYDFVVSDDVPYVVPVEGEHYEETNSLGPETAARLFRAWRRILRWSPPPGP